MLLFFSYSDDGHHLLNGKAVVYFNQNIDMKNGLLAVAFWALIFPIQAQEIKPAGDSILPSRAVLPKECPTELLSSINQDLLKTKAALLVFNESLHPLGRYEFYDAGARVRNLQNPMRMNRCSLLYVDTGVHLFHTMYQQLKEPVYFGPGKIYMARLFSRAAWPLGGISVIRKNEKGEPVEYAAVLFEYINGSTATELFNKMKKKEILVNE